MGRQFTFTDVIRNLAKVKEALCRILVEMDTVEMSESVSKWLPLCQRHRVFFFDVLFHQMSFVDVGVKNVQYCDFQCVDILDYYYE